MTDNASPAIQDRYPAAFAHCYGCGPRNPDGHHLKSRLDGDETLAHFRAAEKYTGGFPGFAYGGLLASLLDCHGAATAAAFAARADGTDADSGLSFPRFVTASLKVDYKRPTPLGVDWVIRGKLKSLEGKKAWVELALTAGDETCVTGEMLAIRIAD